MKLFGLFLVVLDPDFVKFLEFFRKNLILIEFFIGLYRLVISGVFIVLLSVFLLNFVVYPIRFIVLLKVVL